MKWCIAVLALLLAANLYGAPAPKSEGQPTSNQATSEIESKTKDPGEKPNTQPEAAPIETLGGTGLKNRKLSEVFEKFVPSESISADNAVPFPVDI